MSARLAQSVPANEEKCPLRVSLWEQPYRVAFLFLLFSSQSWLHLITFNRVAQEALQVILKSITPSSKTQRMPKIPEV